MVDLSRLMQDAAILEVIDKSADEASRLSAQNSYQSIRIEELERAHASALEELARLKAENEELAALKGYADAMSNMIRGFIFKTVERETLADSAAAYRKWEEDYCHRHGRAAYPKE